MTDQSNAAAERSAHVTRGSGVVPAEWPVVQLPDGTWQLKAVAERDAEIEKLRAAICEWAASIWGYEGVLFLEGLKHEEFINSILDEERDRVEAGEKQ